MAFLLDTNVLLRLAMPSDPAHGKVAGAVAHLADRGETLHICSQNLIELWNVATRPLERNGLGLTPEEAARLLDLFEDDFERLAETDEIFRIWKRLVQTYGVSGAMVHDARLVAAMSTHGVGSILTLNSRDFRRYEPGGVSVLSPDDFPTPVE
jgi:predicted nucleic acid-binding protein